MGKKFIIGIVGVVILILGVATGVFLVQRQQGLDKSAEPATSLVLVTSDISPDEGDEFDVNVEIATNSNEVFVVQIELSFDETKLEVLGAEPGSFIPSAQEIEPSITPGKATYSIFAPGGSDPIQGTGIVASFNFKALGSGITTINFGPGTKAGAENDNSPNVVQYTTPLTLNINESTDDGTKNLLLNPPPDDPQATQGATATPSASPKGGAFDDTTGGITTTPTTQSTTPTATPQTLPDTATITPTMVTSGVGLGLLLIFGVLLLAI